ncbi:restriction endonuclease subunit S [Roseomonas sp. E05]|uniref:restriction endonuclease subunit S n=1 Tax=Roseomonas sp. E05 TaxID=3046310 RepID=UPI0024B922D4|nr:restriction endonuclease subunit S [Roseomonas sp. E05]MDJ0391081.1 restriction endonuclease subunit S [Roseomonas sp. E05]
MLDGVQHKGRYPLVDIGLHVQPVRTVNPASVAPENEFTYVDLSAVDQDNKIINGARKIPGAEAPSRARQVICSGDVLVSTVRPNLNGIAIVPSDLDGAIASTGFCVLRPNQNHLNQNYLFHWARSPTFIEHMVRHATGASYPAVTDRIVRQSLIPLPPLPEQRRIAAILDEADALRAKRRAVLAQLDEMARAIFVEMFGDPQVNEREWGTVALDDLLEDIESGWSPTCLDRPAEGDEWGVLKLGAVTRCIFDPTQNKGLPSQLAPRPALEVKPGDLLFTRKNTHDLVAACAYVRRTPPRLMLPDLIFRLRIKPTASVKAAFLQGLLVFPVQRAAVQKLAGGSAGSMPNISKAKLRQLRVILPPLHLQQEFSAALDELDDLQLSSLVAFAETDHLFSSLQHRAFRGEL